MDINSKIFKAYDVRGVYPSEINEEAVYWIAKAVVKFLKAKSLVLARDMRFSSQSLYRAVLKALKEEGIKIFDVGLSSTPMYMFVINLEKADGGIVVTASHNPAKYNGLRLERKFAESIGEGSGMEEIKEMVLSGNILKEKPKKPARRPQIIEKNYLEKYITFLAKKFSPSDFRGLSVAIDAGNGMTGMILPGLLKKLKVKYYPLYFNLDGTFPHHNPNPAEPENLRDLGKLVNKKKADLGIAFDGDGDRIGFIDSRGQAIDMDYISSLLTKWVLKNHPAEKIVYDLSSSKIVRETIEKNGGRALICRPGHSFFRRLIRKEDAYFGCENSGHCIFRDFFYAEAAILTMLYVLRLVKQSGKKIEDMIAPLKKYFSVLMAIDFKNREKFKVITKKLEVVYASGKFLRLDGLNVEYPDWWFSIRLSNTEPIIRLYIEADSQELLEEKKKEILEKISLR